MARPNPARWSPKRSVLARCVLLAGCVGGAALFLSGLTAASSGAAPQIIGAAPTALPLTNADGLHVISEQQLNPRLLTLSVSTSALAAPADIRILLPSDYAANPGRRYPVLYLFDGTSGHASDWTTSGDAEQTTAGLPVIVVMPDITTNGGGGGWCTNSVNGGQGGTPEWETFHIDQLIPWVDQNFRTIASRDGRAIAGLSQGGFCSMSYAAQFPDMFITAVAYSGAPDIAYGTAAQVGATAIINATEVGLDRVPPDSFFGNPLTDEINWAAHDPATLANNLRGVNLMMYNGNGLPGPLDTAPNPGGSAIEALIGFDNDYFHQRLTALGIPCSWDPYGPGTHSWPYWARDLRQSIGPIMSDFAHPPAAPSSVNYTSAAQQYSDFGWTVALDRTAEEFSTLGNASAAGFTLAGSGAAIVMTPPLFHPGQRYTVGFYGSDVNLTATTMADQSGHLMLIVPLGPANPFQQDTAAAQLLGTRSYTTTVSITQ